MDDEVTISKEEFDLIVAKANIELIQRVNRLIRILEKQYGECEEGESDTSSSVVETS